MWESLFSQPFSSWLVLLMVILARSTYSLCDLLTLWYKGVTPPFECSLPFRQHQPINVINVKPSIHFTSVYPIIRTFNQNSTRLWWAGRRGQTSHSRKPTEGGPGCVCVCVCNVVRVPLCGGWVSRWRRCLCGAPPLWARAAAESSRDCPTWGTSSACPCSPTMTWVSPLD